MPAVDARGLAVKAFLAVYTDRDLYEDFDDEPVIAGFDPEADYQDDGRLDTHAHATLGLVESLVEFLPEVREICAPLLASPVQLEDKDDDPEPSDDDAEQRGDNEDEPPAVVLALDADALIRRKFAEWCAARREAEKAPDGAFDRAMDPVDEIENELMAIPAMGAAGLAAKAYFYLKLNLSKYTTDPCQLSGYDPPALPLLREMVRVMPELGPLAVPALAEDDNEDAGAGGDELPSSGEAP
jgi:hypothetical protein